jgi:Zn-dependent membrane protease YugP
MAAASQFEAASAIVEKMQAARSFDATYGPWFVTLPTELDAAHRAVDQLRELSASVAPAGSR